MDEKKYKINKREEESAYLHTISFIPEDIKFPVISFSDDIENVLFLESEDLDKLIEILQQIKRIKKGMERDGSN